MTSETPISRVSAAPPDTSFEELVRLSGLDPATDFVGENLVRVDFGNADLSAYDLSYARLDGANFSKISRAPKSIEGASINGILGSSKLSKKPEKEHPTNKSLSSRISSHLPFLRRYARALTGSQQSGDAFVAATLESLIDDPSQLDHNRERSEADVQNRVLLYKAFHAIFVFAHREYEASKDYNRTRLGKLPVTTRACLLLSTVEKFDVREIAEIVQMPMEDVLRAIEEGKNYIDTQVSANVLIIEPELIISMDLADTARGLGHKVSAVAKTLDEAVEAARRFPPDLILSEIRLSDGSSGIDAVNQILAFHQAPVIYITAFPDRLLTGERPEPTFLITKPYDEQVVSAAISQALFFENSEAK